MSSLVRKHIVNIVPYEAGKPIEEIKRQLGLKQVIKLASNENPLGPSPKALEAIRKNLATLNRYPDSSGFYLKNKLSKFLNVKPQNLVLGNGSDELIEIIVKTFVEEDEHIITADFTFLEYKIISHVKGRIVVTVPLKYFKYDLEAIRKRIDAKTKVVFISNPNNPTGTYVTKYEIEDFLRDLPENVILVLDEAYDAFIDVDDFPGSLSYIGKNNVILLRTFSKTYGLAGLRIGYAVAGQELISYMETARQPFNTNSLAQAAAIAALEDKKFLSRTRKAVLEGKNYIYDNLNKLGVAYVPSVANFILLDVGRDGSAVFKEMLRYGVIIRELKQYGLKNFIRVTIGTKKENERFIKVLKKVL
ncbi:MAG: histidinol-phosphate transaminase [Candidatus Omnitrophica bacterium]|nr:histidinol-phosphate transaminase [Candidatus Omnitrophota bacterium]MDD5592564.1 histidinol-phosphate transaminase [Candidatus Omnitrophota bacterium]